MSNNTIGSLIDKLDTQNQDVCKVLKKLLYLVNNSDQISIFRKLNGLSKLLEMTKDETFSGRELAMSLLGNCCTNEVAVLQLLKWQAIPIICSILKQSTSEGVRYRACRIIGNMCSYELCCSIVHEDEETVKCIINCLNDCNDINHVLCHAKTIRILSKDEEKSDKMTNFGVVAQISKVLKSKLIDKKEHLRQLLSTLQLFINRWSLRVEDQLVQSHTLEIIASLLKSDNKDISETAYKFVQNLTSCKPLLRSFGNYGFVDCFVKSFEAPENVNDKLRYFEYILSCCQHRSNASIAGINLLLKQMSDPLTKRFTNQILLTLLQISYGSSNFHSIFGVNIVDTLTSILLRHASMDILQYTAKVFERASLNIQHSYVTPLTPSDSSDDLKSNSSYSDLNDLIGDSAGENNEDANDDDDDNLPSLIIWKSADLKKEESEKIPKEFTIDECPSKCKRRRLNVKKHIPVDIRKTSSKDQNPDDILLYSYAKQLEDERLFLSKFNSIPPDLVSLSNNPNLKSNCTESNPTKKNLKRKRVEQINSCEKIVDRMEDRATSNYSENTRGRISVTNHIEILSFITQFVRRPAWIKYFVTKNFIGTMVKCLIVYCDDEIIVQIISKLCGIADYFIPLITEMLPSTMHLLSIDDNDGADCSDNVKRIPFHTFDSLLNNLSNVFKEECKFKLKYILADKSAYKGSIISLSYLTRDKYNFTKFFLQNTIIKTLLEIMYDDQDEYQMLATLAYTYVIQQSQISSPVYSDETNHNTSLVASKSTSTTTAYDVSFQFDGDPMVPSNKHMLSTYSDVFKTMFHGTYKESSMQVIKLPDTSHKLFEIFNSCILTGSMHLLQKSFDEVDVIIGIYQLAHKYMVTSIEHYIMGIIHNNIEKYFDEILNKQVLLNSTTLTFHCIVHICKQLTGVNKCLVLNQIRRYISFNDLLKYSNKLFDDG